MACPDSFSSCGESKEKKKIDYVLYKQVKLTQKFLWSFSGFSSQTFLTEARVGCRAISSGTTHKTTPQKYNQKRNHK